MTEFRRLPDRAVLSIDGVDARDFLQGIVTQEIADMTVGDARFAALLTPQGKILADFFLVATEAGFLVDVARDAAGDLLKRLKMYKLRAAIDLAARDDFAVGVGSHAGDAAAFVDPRLPALGVRKIMRTVENGEEDGDEGAEAYHARRRALGVPEFAADFGPDTAFLLDVNYDLLGAVRYDKGCFVGQEVASRMKRKGEVRRRTLIVEIDGPPPASGSAVRAGASTLGEVLGASAAEDGATALGVLRTDRLAAARETGAGIEVGGAPARVRAPGYLDADGAAT